MAAEKQILEGTAAIKTLESIYADEKLSAEIKKINADACSGMAQAAYYYAAGETQKAETKMLEVKKRTEEATADLRELQYWTEIANTIIKLAQMVGNLAIGGKTGKLIREYTERKMNTTPPMNSSTVTQYYDPEMKLKGLNKTAKQKEQKDIHRLLNSANEKYKTASSVQKETKEERFDVGEYAVYRGMSGHIESIGANILFMVDGKRIKIDKTLFFREAKKGEKPKKLPKKAPKLAVQKPQTAGIKLDLHGYRVEEGIEELDRFISDSLLAGFEEILV